MPHTDIKMIYMFLKSQEMILFAKAVCLHWLDWKLPINNPGELFLQNKI